MEEMVTEIVSEMDYLRTREQRLRDTNESTNNRVKWFGLCTTFVLVVLWVWQILYLRAYFRLVFTMSSFPDRRLCRWDADFFLSSCIQVQAPYLDVSGGPLYSRLRLPEIMKCMVGSYGRQPGTGFGRLV